MSKADDMHKIRNLRCPHCHAPVEPAWNLKATGQVVCMNRCKLGSFAMKPEECIDTSEDEEDLLGVEDLEEVE